MANTEKLTAYLLDEDCKETIQLDEKSSEVDGKHIIGKVRGPFFVPNGTSRNKRYYSEQLWKNTLEDKEVQKKLSERRMVGTISHDQPLDDEALLKGMMSHIVTKLEIDKKGNGIGEALILNTEAGRNLRTMLGAGMKVAVSSRATGRYEGHTGNGTPKVDENSYKLETFDFVIEPGFLQAKPDLVENSNNHLALVESLKQLIDSKKQDINNDTGEPEMSKDLTSVIESQATENAKNLADLKTATAEIETFKNEAVLDKSKIAELEKQVKEFKDDSGIGEEYTKLGTPTEINALIEKAAENATALKTYTDIDTPEDIVEALEVAEKLFDEYKELGTPKEVDETFTAYEAYKKSVDELGTVEELVQLCDFVEKLNEEKSTQKANTEIAELAKELGVEEEKIKTVYGKISNDEIRNMVGAGKTKKKNEERKTRFTKTNVDNNLNEDTKSKNERYTDKGLATQLMSQMRRG